MKAALIVCGALAAAVSGIAQQSDIGPPPGRLVDIGGRNLHFMCSGSGSRTVLLEAGASSFAIDWSLVMPEIARTTRVCAYDRARMGWSDPRGAVDTPANIVADLRKGLAAAGEKPPFVMVGASFGAIYVRLYHLDHPDDVAGLVLVDPSSEDRLFTTFEGKQMVPIASLTAEQLLTTLPTMESVPIPTRRPQTGAPFDRLPPELYQLRIKLDERLIASTPATVPIQVVRDSSEGQRAGLARLLDSRTKVTTPLGDRPLVVLTRGEKQTPGQADNHAGLSRLSTNSRHTIVPGSGHEIHLFAPAAVVEAIQDVIAAMRQRTRVPARAQPSALFTFHSNPWLNLHHYVRLSARGGPAPTGLSPEESAQWTAGVEFYKPYAARDLLMDQGMIDIKTALRGAEDKANLDGIAIDAGLKAALEPLMPIYRKHWWPEHDRGNRAWIAAVQPLLERHGQSLSEALTRTYGTAWPSTPIPVDLTVTAGPNGAYTTGPPTHVTLSSSERALKGYASLEMLFHESSHSSLSDLYFRVRRAATEQKASVPPQLWHAVLFYTAGELTARELKAHGIAYTPYAGQELLTNMCGAGCREKIAEHWTPRLDGKQSVEDALSALVASFR